MFPNSSNLGRPPFHSKHQRQTDCFNTLPVNTSPTLFSDQQTLVPPFNFRTAVLSRALSNGNLAASPAVTLQPMNVSPVSTSGALTSFQGRKRPREESISRNVKHQRIDSQNSDTTVLNQAVPSPEERRQSLPRPISVQSPQFLPSGSPALTSCVPPLRDTLFPDPTEIRPPVAKDQLSQQILELFQACRQQASDLNRKELCRTELQREIQLIFPQSRLYLVGSSLNGFGTRSSDGDLCLIVKEQPVNQKTEARCILSSVHRLFSTKLCKFLATVRSNGKMYDVIYGQIQVVPDFATEEITKMAHFAPNSYHIFAAVAQGDLVYHNPSENIVAEFTSYIERPQLIRAKVPIVKFRDKVSCVDFDLNVNNVVGIRNTFLLRTYAFIENRVRPLVVAVKKWASCHEINDASRGTLNSYSLVLMVLHYLQTLPEPILPSLQKNYPECFDPTMQLHLVHQAPYTIPPYISKNGSSLGDLLTGFFRYYATEFDWSHQMISVREAKAIPRPDGTEWRNKFICVEEPFDGTNTARAVHEKQKFDIIRGEFSQAWRLLRDKKDLNCILPLRANKQKR